MTDSPAGAPADTAAELRTAAGETLPLPLVAATDGASGAGIGKLLSSTQMITYDPGFRNTGSCRSEITYIDGDAGILRYRGYPIQQLAENSNFAEVSYLLINGALPTKSELAEFEQRLAAQVALPDGFTRLLDGFAPGAHPMTMLSAGVTALSSYHQHALDPQDPEQVDEAMVTLLAQLPAIAACAYRKSAGLPLTEADPSAGMVPGFLAMTFADADGHYEPNPVLARALDLLFVLHGDHEQNCSAATVRMVGSARSDLFLSIAAGINALFGPLHGGANAAVMQMLEEIKADGGDVGRFVEKVKAKEKGVRLMGFGHAVYKHYDPRAELVKKSADEVISATSGHDDLLDIAQELEAAALSDDYFISRHLYPNVDFYTGLLYRTMGFPTEMFTVLFALGRLPGWIAQWREMNADPEVKIGRPRQVYTGAPERDYVPIASR